MPLYFANKLYYVALVIFCMFCINRKRLIKLDEMKYESQITMKKGLFTKSLHINSYYGRVSSRPMQITYLKYNKNCCIIKTIDKSIKIATEYFCDIV